jgi:hypothetical protein
MTSRHGRAAIVAGHRTFGPVAALHRSATDDVATRHAILRRILGVERRADRGGHGAAQDERRLAVIEMREPEPWAVEEASAP